MPTSVMQEEANPANRMFNAAETHARSRGYAIGYDATNEIRTMADQAVANLRARRGTQEAASALTDEEIHVGIQAFQRMVDVMIEASFGIPGYREAHPGIIGERTLERARLQLCPFWPIC